MDHTAALRGSVEAVCPEGVDVVFHLAGDPIALLGLVRPGGRFVSTLVHPGQLDAETSGKDVEVVLVYAQPDEATPARLDERATSGAARLPIQQTFPLDEASTAFAIFAAGTLSKLVITTA